MVVAEAKPEQLEEIAVPELAVPEHWLGDHVTHFNVGVWHCSPEQETAFG
jgi:hypothetical protein